MTDLERGARLAIVTSPALAFACGVLLLPPPLDAGDFMDKDTRPKAFFSSCTFADFGLSTIASFVGVASLAAKAAVDLETGFGSALVLFVPFGWPLTLVLFDRPLLEPNLALSLLGDILSFNPNFAPPLLNDELFLEANFVDSLPGDERSLASNLCATLPRDILSLEPNFEVSLLEDKLSLEPNFDVALPDKLSFEPNFGVTLPDKLSLEPNFGVPLPDDKLSLEPNFAVVLGLLFLSGFATRSTEAESPFASAENWRRICCGVS